ncbi:hypothetical protein IV203_007403 [Nitzschia inconspicua]|uniref:Uncharacterized protein n=1 Tax=Nitzschia inconspicua TaxID=303405 RepID=A0A9K3PCX6_9STRA|nr:hypothetical protein IV203_007403 [Nitzschia inconspicua]
MEKNCSMVKTSFTQDKQRPSSKQSPIKKALSCLIYTHRILDKHHGKGRIQRGSHRAAQAVCQRLGSFGEKVHQTRPKGICRDCSSDGSWFPDHGIHWVLCQAHPYSNQQHFGGKLKERIAATF